MPELVHNETRLLTNAEILAGALSIEMSRVLEFTYAYACLNASQCLRIGDEEMVQWSLNVAMIIEPHVDLFYL